MPIDHGDANDDAHLSMMERRPWTRRVRLLPKRYRDLLPESPPFVPPEPADSSLPAQESSPDPPSEPSSPLAVLARLRRFKTQRNKFGLFRDYNLESPPSHDPEEHMTLEDLTDAADQNFSLDSSPNAFHPYPNRNSFRLGDWYWNGGTNKSQASFKELVDIIGDPEFTPADVRHTNWGHINRSLADDANWLDDDAGWEKTPVTILIPIQHGRNPVSNIDAVPQEYVVHDFYHRSIVLVIREKLSKPDDDDHFHYEPYTLKWQPGGVPNPTRVHGEIYMSGAFRDAHNALQNSPPEPGCTLPRHIIALMFCSDSTHLTSFGDTKLWPLYLYFGNESKYRRCKPSCQLSNHIAYFQRVRHRLTGRQALD
jgi:Plavaka transposase